ncbi:MAG: hypothetical protein KDA44_19370 [Planctomycetales bacterium]|nr:hypothetical protein [Planctomycetales bacterium]
MKYRNGIATVLTLCAFVCGGCSKPAEPSGSQATDESSASADAGEHAHGSGPNGGVVFDLGSHHAEFTVDHGQQQVTILFLGADEKSAQPIAAEEFILNIQETATAEGTPVPAMTITMLPQEASDGTAAAFVGTDPGIGNVADFAGMVSGEIDGKPVMGEFAE